MTALILHRGPITEYPYADWFAGYGDDLILLAAGEDLASRGQPPPTGYRHVELVGDWDTGGDVEARALELGRRHRVTSLIARHERDLQRAAMLREMLDLPGQRPAGARAFRDKAVMKGIAAAAGIAVPEFAAVETDVDALRFARAHGFPVVLKPRTGAGSVDNWIVRSAAELIDVLDGPLAPYRTHHPNLLIESFVPGTMYHIDGIVLDGRLELAWPSHYLDMLSSYRDGSSRLDVALDPGDQLFDPLLRFTRRLLAALPTPPNCSFHLEVFHTPDDRIVLCEIACRTGGAAIRQIWKVMFDIDLTQLALQGQLGLAPEAIRHRTPRRIAGQCLVMKRAGRVMSFPEELPFPGVEHYRRNVAVGQEIGAPRFSGDVAAAIVMSGPTGDGCERRLRELRDWLDREVVIR